jgi:hypothetical protein
MSDLSVTDAEEGDAPHLRHAAAMALLHRFVDLSVIPRHFNEDTSTERPVGFAWRTCLARAASSRDSRMR